MQSKKMPLDRLCPTVRTMAHGCAGWLLADHVIVDQNANVYLHRDTPVLESIPKPLPDHMMHYVRVLKHPIGQQGTIGIRLEACRKKWIPTAVSALVTMLGTLHEEYVQVSYIEEDRNAHTYAWEKPPEIDESLLCKKGFAAR